MMEKHKAEAVTAAIGGVVAVAAVPVALTAIGFTGTGIAGASIAAKMMSAAAIANGGGVAAGSMVATLQSVGVLGLSTTTNAILGGVGAAIGYLF
ncbi:interferon alpha-inducible protein 27-like protein 2A isoform X1 [Microtus ochrogaster]|uniref:Interferon alpha-inducible protein 27-like protein 2A isoform X1 n=1 Tax=Microtus ochrogaster TaxID=79684 RepID=A0ABM1AWS9_MICOH|nr:interferon alpha-inducible protein 27-like protein 2A isoform X1 [Microtus ochrogaster]